MLSEYYYCVVIQRPDSWAVDLTVFQIAETDANVAMQVNGITVLEFEQTRLKRGIVRRTGIDDVHLGARITDGATIEFNAWVPHFSDKAVNLQIVNQIKGLHFWIGEWCRPATTELNCGRFDMVKQEDACTN